MSAISPTTEEWASVLKLATQWQFDDVRAESIDTLERLERGLIRRILLGRQYSVSKWLIAAYVNLVERAGSSPLTEEEEAALGDSAVARLRELETQYKEAGTEKHKFSLTRKVRELFEDELIGDEEYQRINTGASLDGVSVAATDGL